MIQPNNPPNTKVVCGYPHLSLVQKSIKTLYKSFPSHKIQQFVASISPNDLLVNDVDDITVAVQRLAGNIVRYFGLPEGSVLVSFRRNLPHPAQVELTSEENYLVYLHEYYRDNHQDIAALLAHEVAHIFLYQENLSFPITSDNEILTDTAAAYLGVGWACLNAFRILFNDHTPGAFGSHTMTTITASKVGYLTPEEFGYVLAKRSLVFHERIDRWLTLQARELYQSGLRMARLDYKHPPLRRCGFWRRILYYWRCWRIEKAASQNILLSFNQYQLERVETITRVLFTCPVCFQKLRLPAYKRRIQLECSTCKTPLECIT